MRNEHTQQTSRVEIPADGESLLDLGLKLNPLYANTKKPIRRGFLKSQGTRNREQLAKAFDKQGGPWVGLVMNQRIPGDGRYLLSIDADEEKGMIALKERFHRDVPVTATMITPDGVQLLFGSKEPVPTHTILTRYGVPLEVKGAGSQIVIPPTPDGRHWAMGLAPGEVGFADAPEWALQVPDPLCDYRPGKKPDGHTLAFWCDQLARAPKGARHATLAQRPVSLVWRLSWYIANHGWDEGKVREALQEAAIACGLEADRPAEAQQALTYALRTRGASSALADRAAVVTVECALTVLRGLSEAQIAVHRRFVERLEELGATRDICSVKWLVAETGYSFGTCQNARVRLVKAGLWADQSPKRLNGRRGSAANRYSVTLLGHECYRLSLDDDA